MDEHGFDRWLKGYGDAWERQDPDAAVRLFAGEAKYYETPFDAPMVGLDAVREYWSEGAAAQRDIHFAYDLLALVDNTGIARWTSSFTRVPSGVVVRLDGMLSALFDKDGLCVEFREWWHREETAAK